MTPRQAYVAKRLGIVALIGLAVFGYVHGTYWAGGLKPAWTGAHLNRVEMPWQALMIDFAPFFAPFGALALALAVLGVEILVDSVAAPYRRLPRKAELAAARQWERKAEIARLEGELGLVPQAPRPPAPQCSHHYRLRLVTVGFPDREVCKYCGKVLDDSWRAEA